VLGKAAASNDTADEGPIEFCITSRELDRRTTMVSIEGELDLSTAPRLKWLLLDSLHEGRDQLIVDLIDTTFMDSTALGVLVAVNRKLDPPARMAIACSRENVLKVFELSGMDAAFSIFPTVEEAQAQAQQADAGAG
jgi:anti-sigma B factor antagonist